MQFLLAALALAGVMANQSPVVWGGEHIAIKVTSEGATVEFDCARGTIDGPLRVDGKGAFRVKGTFTPEVSGPSRDDNPPVLKAIYSGTIKGEAMALRMVLDGDEASARTFELVRDQPGNVRKCR